VLWPDFKKEHIVEAILDYQRRTEDLEGYEVAKTRVISALVGVILLIAVVCSGQMVLGTAVFLFPCLPCMSISDL